MGRLPPARRPSSLPHPRPRLPLRQPTRAGLRLTLLWAARTTSAGSCFSISLQCRRSAGASTGDAGQSTCVSSCSLLGFRSSQRRLPSARPPPTPPRRSSSLLQQLSHALYRAVHPLSHQVQLVRHQVRSQQRQEPAGRGGQLSAAGGTQAHRRGWASPATRISGPTRGPSSPSLQAPLGVSDQLLLAVHPRRAEGVGCARHAVVHLCARVRQVFGRVWAQHGKGACMLRCQRAAAGCRRVPAAGSGRRRSAGGSGPHPCLAGGT